MENTDAALVRLAAGGDTSAFRELVDRYQKRVYGIAWGMTGNHSDADDAAQETFIKAYRKLGEFKGDSGFYTWLYRIAMNSCLDLLRRRGRRAELDLDGAMEAAERRLAEEGGAGPDALRQAEGRELREAVARGVATLSPKHRSVLVLHDIEGMPHEEVARVLGCSPGTVRSRLHYARLKMQRRLKEYVA